MDFSRIQVITFDCYGTLIDWETGILRAVRTALPGLIADDSEILGTYSEIEPRLQSHGYQCYRAILRQVLLEMAQRFSVTCRAPDALAESLTYWAPFPDTVTALRRLKSRYKLGVISNIDDDLFAASAARLGVPFDFVITAQQVESYKPAVRNFEVALSRIGTGKETWLHAAESLFHDIAPARQLGIQNVWVNRRGDRAASASGNANVQPDFVVKSLAELAEVLA